MTKLSVYYLTEGESLQIRKKWQGIFDAFHDLVPFVQFKKRKKHQWRSALGEVAGLFAQSITFVFRSNLEEKYSNVIYLKLITLK